MAAFAKVEINEQSFQQAETFLTQLPLELRTAVIPKALNAAATPVVRQARIFAPDSTKSGNRLLWSKKVREKRSGAPQLKDTIVKSRVRTTPNGLSSIHVWPQNFPGNLINVLGHTHEQILWGRHTGNMLPATQFLVNAAQQTLGEQQSAFVGKVQSETTRLLSKGATP